MFLSSAQGVVYFSTELIEGFSLKLCGRHQFHEYSRRKTSEGPINMAYNSHETQTYPRRVAISQPPPVITERNYMVQYLGSTSAGSQCELAMRKKPKL